MHSLPNINMSFCKTHFNFFFYKIWYIIVFDANFWYFGNLTVLYTRKIAWLILQMYQSSTQLSYFAIFLQASYPIAFIALCCVKPWNNVFQVWAALTCAIVLLLGTRADRDQTVKVSFPKLCLEDDKLLLCSATTTKPPASHQSRRNLFPCRAVL